MIRSSCPACGAEIRFQSSISIFAVCKHCQSNILREGDFLKDLGKMAQVAPEISAVQIGTSGLYFQRAFTVIGKSRMAWDEGFWNEWYLIFQDGRVGWLAEAQGFYGISLPSYPAKSLPALSELSVGKILTQLTDTKLEVNDFKKAKCIASEGELPYLGLQGREVTSVELSGPRNTFATLEYSEGDPQFYLGHYLDFDEMKLSNLRKIDGW